MRRATTPVLLLVLVVLAPSSAVFAQETRASGEHRSEPEEETADRREAPPRGDEPLGDEETANRIVNELADLVQVPLAHNFEWGLGATEEGFRYLLTARPRVPIHIVGEWMVVTVGFFRFNFVDDVLAPDGTGAGSFVGMGDLDIYSLIAPPRLVEGLLFGLGPFALFPSGNPRFSVMNMGIGPAVGVSWQGEGVALNLTVLHAFSFVDDETDYSQTQLIPSISYVFDTGTAIVVQSETVYEWHSDTWLVPLNVGVSQVLSPGPLFRMSVGILGKWWPVSPVAGPDWGLRLVTTLLFPDLDT